MEDKEKVEMLLLLGIDESDLRYQLSDKLNNIENENVCTEQEIDEMQEILKLYKLLLNYRKSKNVSF